MYNSYLEEGAKVLEICRRGGLVDKATMEKVYNFIWHYEHSCKKLKPIKTEQAVVHTELGDINVFKPVYDIAQWTSKVEEYYNYELNRGKREIEEKKQILNDFIQRLANFDTHIEKQKQQAYNNYMEFCQRIDNSAKNDKNRLLSRIADLQKEIAYLEQH